MSSSLFTFQRHDYNNQFRSHFDTGFEDWFSLLARRLHPNGDVQSIRLTQGDGKLDVTVLSEQLVYQCYAPSRYSPSKAAEKIKADFWGALDQLDGELRKWIFVHNHASGKLDKDSYGAINSAVAEVQKRGLNIKLLAWGIEELWEELQARLAYAQLRELFGEPDPVFLDYATIEQVLRTLERSDYPEDAEPLSKPDVDKLKFNDLGPAYREAIRHGRPVAHVVGRYFADCGDPEFGERLAQRFRERYRRLKEMDRLPPDMIFENLRFDAGWKATPDAKRELATMAVLSYFFHQCDIFENVPL